MNKSDAVEDQPRPEETSSAEANMHMQAAVQGLGNALVGKFQANGNVFNALELELKCTIMGEAIHMLTALVMDLSAGKYNDTSITLTMIERIEALTKAMTESTRAPKLLLAGGALPSRVNGSKHN